MLERDTRDKEEREEAKRGKKVQPVHDELKQAAQPEDSQEKQALAEMPVTELAFLARDPQVFGAQRAKAMLNLQQTHGNRYVQRLAEGNKQAPLDEETMRSIEAQRGSGKPLEPTTRSEMGAAFGQDFGGVRIHTDANAAKLARELGAKAFTTGKDIFFEEGASDLGSEAGKRVLGHELTHVVQQDLWTVRGGEISKPNEPAEAEAQRVGEAISCARQPLPIKASAAQVSRQLFGGVLGGPAQVAAEVGIDVAGRATSGGETQAATTTTAEAPAAEKGLDKTRLAALKAMFEAAIVQPCRTAYKALNPKEPNAQLALQNIGLAVDVIRSINTTYRGVEPMWSRLIATENALIVVMEQLGPYAAIPSPPILEISENLNPDGKIMSTYFEGIRSQF